MTVTLEAFPSSTTVDDGSTLIATVLGEGDTPLEGITVTFTVVSGSGEVSPETATTGPLGTTTSSLSSTELGDVTVQAAVDSLTDTTTVTFVAGEAVTLTLTPESQDVVVDETGAGSAELSAEVVDQYGNPVVDGTQVNFTTDVGAVDSPVATADGVAATILSVTDVTETVTATVRAWVAGVFPLVQDTALATFIVTPCTSVEIVDVTSDSPVCLGEAMHFTATVTGDEPISYSWDFGGAGTATGEDTATPTFTYDEAGTYTVTLTVENDCGTDEDTLVVEVGEPVEIVDLASDSPVMVHETMSFEATVTGDEPISYSWDFGGPGTPTGEDTATPTFTYDEAGTYTVTLTVENECGTDEDTLTVTVEPYTLYMPIIKKNGS
jgi:PKD repeat protein